MKKSLSLFVVVCFSLIIVSCGNTARTEQIESSMANNSFDETISPNSNFKSESKVDAATNSKSSNPENKQSSEIQSAPQKNILPTDVEGTIESTDIEKLSFTVSTIQNDTVNGFGVVSLNGDIVTVSYDSKTSFVITKSDNDVKTTERFVGKSSDLIAGKYVKVWGSIKGGVCLATEIQVMETIK